MESSWYQNDKNVSSNFLGIKVKAIQLLSQKNTKRFIP